jgi:hypothetical protein
VLFIHLFIYCSFNDFVSNADWWNDYLMNNELEWIWKQVVMAFQRDYPDICLEGLENYDR